MQLPGDHSFDTLIADVLPEFLQALDDVRCQGGDLNPLRRGDASTIIEELLLEGGVRARTVLTTLIARKLSVHPVSKLSVFTVTSRHSLIYITLEHSAATSIAEHICTRSRGRDTYFTHTAQSNCQFSNTRCTIRHSNDTLRKFLSFAHSWLSALTQIWGSGC